MIDQLVIVWIFAVAAPSLMVVVVVHELGHALAARAVGFRLLGVRVGPLMATATPAGWRVRFTRSRWLAGAVTAEPARPDGVSWRHAVMTGGGSVASLLLAGAAIGAAAIWGGRLWLAWVCAFLLTGAFVVNVVPLGARRKGLWLDGDWLLAWLLHPELARQRVAVGPLVRAVQEGTRPRDLDERWVRLAGTVPRQLTSELQVVGCWLAYAWALDRGQIDEAGGLLARAFGGRRLLEADACASLVVEAAFFVARHRRRLALAARLLDAGGSAAASAAGAADALRAEAAIHLASARYSEAAAACDRAFAALDGRAAEGTANLDLDRSLLQAMRDEARGAVSAGPDASPPDGPGRTRPSVPSE